MKPFHEKVAEARHALHLTQQELADKAGLSKRTIAAYETVGANPTGRNIRRLADALEVTPEYLTAGQADDPADASFSGSLEQEYLLKKIQEMFASKDIRDADKMKFFESVMGLYLSYRRR
ncbi:MAG: helix-turn-helix transcriptional regulator [Clostridia bacterium]|nr:helix-turn-helix transcriptional regulator [Clostridia bacterium]